MKGAKTEEQICARREYYFMPKDTSVKFQLSIGGFSTHIQVDENWTFPIPDNLDIEVSAPILCAGITVYAPLNRYGKPGKTCAIIGIGGLGHLAIQYASKMGMTVTAFTTKTQTPEPYKNLGATYV